MFPLTEDLEEQASLYASGAMTALERAQFELVIEFHEPLRDFTRGLLEVTASATLTLPVRRTPSPSGSLKSRILGALGDHRQACRQDGFVMTGPDGLVSWVNDSFSAMCGYSLQELQGKKLGPILQGKQTDPAAVDRIREAVNNRVPVTEALVNYHKNGTPYWVALNITPIFDSNRELLWFVARETELPERAVAA
jgi:PAS domain S-box-containing protein